MARLIFRMNSLERARRNFDRLDRRQHNNEIHIDFVRERNSCGSYSTKPHIRIVRNNSRLKQDGLLHSIDYTAKYQITGDIPSVRRKIESFQPRSIGGKIAKLTLKTTNNAVSRTGRTVWDIGLAAETGVIKSARVSARKSKDFIKKNTISKYRNTANDDTNKAIITFTSTAFDGAISFKQHLQSRKNFDYERAKYKLQKEELKAFKRDVYRPKLSKIQFRRTDNRINILNPSKARLDRSKVILRNTSRYDATYNQKRGMVKARKIQLKQHKIEFRALDNELATEKKKLKLELKTKKKELNIQYKIQKHSDPGLLITKPLKYSANKMTASAWQKVAVSDDRDDTVQAITKVHDAAEIIKKRPNKLQKDKEQNYHLKEKSGKKEHKLQQQNQRLQERSSILNEKWKEKRTRPKNYKKRSKFAKEIILSLKPFLVFICIVFTFLMTAFIIFTILESVIQAIYGNNGWIMGTYNAQDKYLSQAEQYYTEIASSFNNKLMTVGDQNTWKNGLILFDVDVDDYDDEPDEIRFGRSDFLNYDPNYDFDREKLWSFLCAYYYTFSEEDTSSLSDDSSSAVKNKKAKDIPYWKFGEDTKKIIQDLFEDEYIFEHEYVNYSHWEEKSPYTFYGGGTPSSGASYYNCISNAEKAPSGSSYSYRFQVVNYPNAIMPYRDPDDYIYLDNNYRILDPYDDFKETGYYVYDNRYYADNNRTIDPFYKYNGRFFFTLSDDEDADEYYRTYLGWGSEQAWFIIPAEDANVCRASPSGYGWYGCYERFVWVTDCILYYNVKTFKPFDRVIEDKLKSMDHGLERYKYYEMFLGTAEGAKTTRGNHQLFASPLDKNMDELLSEGKILNGFGYDIQKWNEHHCAIEDKEHKAIDIVCVPNTNIKAGFDGTVDSVTDDMIVIRHNNFDYWYDGDGRGKKRSTKIYYYNVHSGLSQGNKVKAGDVIGRSLPQSLCPEPSVDNSDLHQFYIHVAVEIDTDGVGWDYIDPLLLLN